MIRSNYKSLLNFAFIPESKLNSVAFQLGLSAESFGLYLQYAFEMCNTQDKIIKTDEYAYFNLGYRDYYVFFEKNRNENQQPWCLSRVGFENEVTEHIEHSTTYAEFDISLRSFAYAHPSRYNYIIPFFNGNQTEAQKYVEEKFKIAYQSGFYVEENKNFIFNIGRINPNSDEYYYACFAINTSDRVDAPKWFLKGFFTKPNGVTHLPSEYSSDIPHPKPNPTSSTDCTLLSVATPTEFEQLKSVLREHNLTFLEEFSTEIGGRRLDYLVIPKLNVIAISTGKSFNCTIPLVQAILKFKPRQAIFSGIAFGFDLYQAPIGSIVISSTVWDYESARINSNDKVHRGYKLPADMNLVNKYSERLIRGKIVKTGDYACGMKVVDSAEYRDEIKTKEPEVVAGDQESFFFAHTCNEFKVNWIVVKGISDYGFKKTNDNQDDSAYAAIEWTLKGLGGF